MTINLKHNWDFAIEFENNPRFGPRAYVRYKGSETEYKSWYDICHDSFLAEYLIINAYKDLEKTFPSLVKAVRRIARLEKELNYDDLCSFWQVFIMMHFSKLDPVIPDLIKTESGYIFNLENETCVCTCSMAMAIEEASTIEEAHEIINEAKVKGPDL